MAELREVKENLYNALKELGLSDLEIKLYTISLLLGPSPITNLAKQIGISRPNLYKVIAGLERHGLAKFTEREKYARTFIVESPSLVLEKLRRKQEAFDLMDHKLITVMPDLTTLYRQGETPTKIKVLEGKEQFTKVLNQIIDEAKDQVEFFGSASDIAAFTTWEVQREYVKKRKAKGIKIRSLVLPSKDTQALKQLEKEELRETRILRGANPFITSFNIFANKVAIWQPKAPLVLLIEDQYIVQMFRSMFYALYDKARPE